MNGKNLALIFSILVGNPEYSKAPLKKRMFHCYFGGVLDRAETNRPNVQIDLR